MNHRFTTIRVDADEATLEIALNGTAFPSVFTLYVDGTAFPSSEATLLNFNSLARWSTPLDWSGGSAVQLSMTAPPEFVLEVEGGNNRVTEGESLTITGALSSPTSGAGLTKFTAGSNQTWHDVTIELSGYRDNGTDLSGAIRPNSTTFSVKVTTVDDNITEASVKPVTVTVLVDLDRDGTFETEQSITIFVIDNDTNAIVMTSDSPTLTEGGDYVTVTLTVFDPAALPEGGALVLVSGSGTAKIQTGMLSNTGTFNEPIPDWDYRTTPSQWESRVANGETIVETFSYFHFAKATTANPTGTEHTLRLIARDDEVGEPVETIILTAVDLNQPALRGTITLTIPAGGV